MDADLLVLGGGPAGLACALRGAEQGARVVLVEREEVGGTCLHRGCVPTVATLEAGRLARALAHQAPAWGFPPAEGLPDLARVRRRRQEGIRRMAAGVRQYLEALGVQVVEGSARPLPGGPRLEVETRRGGRERLEGKALLLAPGSAFVLPPIPGSDLPAVWTPDHCLDAQEPPRSLVVYAGGFLGVEWAQFFRALGAEVVLLEPGPSLLPGEDPEVVEVLRFHLERSGIAVHLNAPVRRLEAEGKGVRAVGPWGTAFGERFLFADPRSPQVRDLAEAGLPLRQGALAVDEGMATPVPGVYGAGDVTGGRMLSSFARAQGEVACENALGGSARFDPQGCPRVYHTWPEVAGVGLTEEEARARGHEVVVGRAELGWNARALTLEEEVGLVKVVADRIRRRVLGVHMVGPMATEAIAQAVLALRLEALADDLADLVHGHPTLAEALAEAGRDAVRRMG